MGYVLLMTNTTPTAYDLNAIPGETWNAQPCSFCGATDTRKVGGPHWHEDAWMQVLACRETCRDLMAKPAPRKRAPRATTMPATDGNYMAMLMGATKVRR